jgi:hypothetical protein
MPVHSIAHSVAAREARHRDSPVVIPDARVFPESKIAMTRMAETTTVFSLEPEPVTHRDRSCECHAPIAP